MKLWVKLIILSLILGCYSYMIVASHEQVHQRICEKFGGGVKSMHVGIFSGGVTCFNNTQTSNELHVMNEIYSYNANPMLAILFLIFTILYLKKN